MEKGGVTVIDDGFHILGEYLNKTSISPPRGVGDLFLKFLLRNAGNTERVEQVSLREGPDNEFAEFPNSDLHSIFDPPDRKFAAVAHAHPDRPLVWQAADCKWLDWWPALQEAGVAVEFLCPDDACGFYRNKFPAKPLPALPG